MGQRKSAKRTMKSGPLAAGLALIAALAVPSYAAAQGQAASPFPPPPPPGQTGVFGPPPGGAPAPASQASPFPSAPQQNVFPQGGGGGGGAPSVFGAPQQQMAAQCQAFPKYRDDARQKADKVSDVSKRHGDRKEMCGAVTRFAEAEDKVVKFLSDNQAACGIPAQAVQQARQGHAQTLKFRDTVCAEGPKPKVPTLSDAIPTTPVDTSKNTRTGPGTFDTLTGNPLQR